jgi:long-chain fatty acid transport protein
LIVSQANRLDRDGTVGFGFPSSGRSVERSNAHEVDVFLNVINYGDTPVDTGPSLMRGRVVGQNLDSYAIVFDMTCQF